MKIEFTPGPWKITYSPDGKEAYINRGHVASVELDDNEQGEANAKLIAAAPELLEALEEALPGLEELNGEFQEGWGPTIDLIEKAISKAKGKQQ